MSQERRSIPTRGSTAAGMFTGAHNFIIDRSVLIDIQTTVDTTGDQLSSFYKLCSPAAIFDSEERGVTTKCLEGTALSSLNQIRDWSDNVQGPPILWLSGPMGTGKTSIAQTIAEEWASQGRAIATFFFTTQIVSYYAQSRRTSWIRYIYNYFIDEEDGTPESKRDRIPIILTLAYQLVMRVPALKQRILSTIHNDPSLQNAKMSKQFEQLIANPIRDLYPGNTVILLIDALDECNNPQTQVDLLEVVSYCARDRDLGVKFLISSRPERVIGNVMHNLDGARYLRIVSLERTEEIDIDISLYLSHEFQKIQMDNPTTFQYDHDVIEELMERASGQFVFASTVVKYVGESSRNPTRQLNDIKKISIANTNSARPFQNLDELYYTILRNSGSNRTMLSKILGYVVATGGLLSLHQLDVICSLTKGDSIVTLRPLLSLLQMPDTATICGDHSVIRKMHVRVLHASFQEFLTDSERSQKYHVDVSNIYAEAFSLLCAKELVRLYQLATDEALGIRNAADVEDEVQDIIDIFSTDVIVETASPISFVIHFAIQINFPKFIASVLRFWYAVIIFHSRWGHFKRFVSTRYFRVSMCSIWLLSWWATVGVRYDMDFISRYSRHLFAGNALPLAVYAPLITIGSLIGSSVMYPSIEWLRVLANASLASLFAMFLSPAITLSAHFIIRLPYSLELVRTWICSFAVILYARPQMDDHILSLADEGLKALYDSDHESEVEVPQTFYLRPVVSSDSEDISD